MKKKVHLTENLLSRIPVRSPEINWTTDENAMVTLEIMNKGILNKIFQIFFKKPKISFIHLDETGSFVWPLIDGKLNLIEIGKLVEEHFGEKANPLYERLYKYFQILEEYKFISWSK